MSLENLLVVLAVVLVAFFNVILPWLRKQREGGQPGETESELQEAPPPAAAPMPLASSAPEPEARHDALMRARVPLAAAMPPTAVRRSRRSPVGSLADARRGIVLGTVLGPCRALKPFDSSSN